MNLQEIYKDDLWDISELEVGTILRDWFDEGIRILLIRGPVSINVYMGIPLDHPLAGHHYDLLPIECHGGLTFSEKGLDYFPKDFYWYGYDYAHAGDCTQFKGVKIGFDDDKKWTLKEIVDDSWEAVYDMKRLANLAEEIMTQKLPFTK